MPMFVACGSGRRPIASPSVFPTLLGGAVSGAKEEARPQETAPAPTRATIREWRAASRREDVMGMPREEDEDGRDPAL